METILQVQNLFKEYPNGFRAINDVTFEVPYGEIFGLLGPNGAGKTTIIRSIAGTLNFSKGNVKIKDISVRKNPEEARKYIGVLTTDIGLYDRLSGKENLAYFGKLYGLEKAKIEKRIEELSKFLNMEGFIEKRAGTYSTGMKQKVAIARSVIHDPELIIFDEPTSGLDVLASQTVRNFMLKSKENGKSVIFSTHQMHDAEKLCDKVIIIHKGQTIASGKVQDLMQENNTSDLEDTFLYLVKNK